MPWNNQVVANGPAHDRTALAYENGSKSLVAYMDSSGLRVANKGGGGGWSSATIDPQGLAGLDMVMDSRGYPHISYLSSDAKVKVAVRAMREVELTPAEAALTAHTGSYVTYVLQLANKGNVLDTYDLSVDNTWHTAVLPQATVTLAPGATAEVTVQLRVPETVAGEDIATVTATSQMRSEVSATAELKTAVQPGQWLVSTAVPGPDNAHASSLALDAAGLPYISFGSDTGILEIINMRSGGWRATLPALGQVNPDINTVLRFAESGLPSVAFADAANEDAATIVTWEYAQLPRRRLSPAARASSISVWPSALQATPIWPWRMDTTPMPPMIPVAGPGTPTGTAVIMCAAPTWPWTAAAPHTAHTCTSTPIRARSSTCTVMASSGSARK